MNIIRNDYTQHTYDMAHVRISNELVVYKKWENVDENGDR